MSRNAPQTQRPQDDPWAVRREPGGFSDVWHVGRGKSRHWEFRGQQPGETVKAVKRKHVWFLITPAFPLIGSILGLIIIFVLSADYPSAGSIWNLLKVVFAFLIAITGFFFIYNDLVLWWVETYIITDRRVRIRKGLITPSRQEAPIENVVQVGVKQKTWLSKLLSYGDLHLYLIGGQGAVLEKVPNPKELRDLFNRVTEEVQRSKPRKETPPQPANRDLLDVLAKLSKNESLPPLPDADEKYRHLDRPDRVRGPLRTFGGPLRLPCDVAYTSDEHTVMYIQRSRSVLIVRLILPIFLLFVNLILYFSLLHSGTIAIIVFLILLFWIGLVVLNYIDDVFILTNQRIIDIDRKFIFFGEDHTSAVYGQIKDVIVDVSNPLFLALDVGKVVVQTPGDNPNIEISPADHPFSLQDKIVALKGYVGKMDKIKGKNELKNELNEWFSTVLATMEQNVKSRGVPNLQTLDLFTAVERAEKLGMKVVPIGEDSSYPNIAPGHIVSQNPMPGTLVQVATDDPEQKPQIREIRVILSRHP